jgi:translation initiation factor IF-2
MITVREFSQLTTLPVNAIMAELMKNGIFASLNEKIDYDTAWLVGSEFGIEVKQTPREEKAENEAETADQALEQILAGEKNEDLKPRPPIIVVMGHVDHGKTRLLDAIRTTNVVSGEAGGITQHIGAYQVEKSGQTITFIDTPGHEAFTAMRSRGAKVADIAILVVAADDGVKPQTTEAFRIIKNSGIPFVIAINKMDKPEANIDKTKQELSNQLGIIPEDWGGKTICQPVSALNGSGIDDLLDMVLLTAQTESDKIKANPDGVTVGTIVESHLSKETGPVATILVKNGRLSVGDDLMLDDINIGKVRSLNNYLGERIEEAGPSTPAQIIGLKNSPRVGDIVMVGKGAKVKRRKFRNLMDQTAAVPASQTEGGEEAEETNKLNLVIKSDVLGSAEAIEESLAKLDTADVAVRILHKGLGNINESDVKKAEAANARIIGFNVKTPPALAELIREKEVAVHHYSVIYDLINDIKAEIREMMTPVYEREDIGKLEVKAVFRTEKKSQIVGGRIIEGRAENDLPADIYRGDNLLATGKITNLQSGREEVSSVEANQECGIRFEGEPVIQEGDTIHLFRQKEIKQKL